MKGALPVATTATSGAAATTASAVTFSLRWTRTPAFLIWRTCHDANDASSCFPGGTAARRHCPPSLSPASYRSTIWPLAAATSATSMPAMPPPITMTLFASGSLPSLKSKRSAYSASRPVRGLSAQCTACPRRLSPAQPRKHAMHGMMSSGRPCATFSGNCGSAKDERPMPTKSVASDAMSSSAMAGSEIRPTTAIGTSTTSLSLQAEAA